MALVRHVKPQLYELTEDEHATLRRARREVGTTRSAPSPVPVSGDLAESAGTAGGNLERAAQLVRYLEDVGLFPGLVLHYPSSLGVGETDDAGAEGLAAEAGDITLVSLLRLARYDGTGSPTRGRGLDEIGRFAYSLPEVEDRLRLIETITQAWAGRPERRADVDRLDSVRWRLESWRSELQRQSVEMGAPYWYALPASGQHQDQRSRPWTSRLPSSSTRPEEALADAVTNLPGPTAVGAQQPILSVCLR